MSSLFNTTYTDCILEMKGVSKRSAFIVNKVGIIKYAEVMGSAGDLPNFETINQTLEQLN